MNERTAACDCGQVHVTCQGDPASVSLCHCLSCQRRTGGPFGVAAFFLRSAVQFAGVTSVYRRASDSGFDVSFHFCPACGSTVWWEPHRKPDMIAVGAGAFADPYFPAPTKAAHPDHRHRWLPADLV